MIITRSATLVSVRPNSHCPVQAYPIPPPDRPRSASLRRALRDGPRRRPLRCPGFTYSYDPYGAPTLTQTSGGNGVPQNPYTFKQGTQDRTTGWIKYGARYYSPANANRYTYAANNPINLTDPTGEASACSDFTVAAGSFTVATGFFGIGAIFATGTIVGAPAGVVLGVATGISAIGAGISTIGAGYSC